MYVNMNGILAAQRPGARPATRPGGIRGQLGAGLGLRPRLARGEPQSLPGKGSRPLWPPLRLPVRGRGPCGPWRAPAFLAPLGALRLARVLGMGPGGVLGRRFILRSLGMIRSIVTGFRRIYEDRRCAGGRPDAPRPVRLGRRDLVVTPTAGERVIAVNGRLLVDVMSYPAK